MTWMRKEKVVSRSAPRRLALLAACIAGAATAAFAAEVADSPKGPIMEKDGWRFVSFSDGVSVYMKRPEAKALRQPIRQVWTVYDSEKPRDRMGFAFMSVASLGEYDCRKRLSRTVRETFHSMRGLTGETWVQPNFIPTAWAMPGEGTVGEARMEFVCPKTKV
jgi:hypothetical protein